MAGQARRTLKQVKSAEEVSKRHGRYISAPSRTIRSACDAYDKDTGEFLFSLLKGAVPDQLLERVPKTCTVSRNRMDAAGPVDRKRPETMLARKEEFVGSHHIRGADGVLRSRPVRSHTIGYTGHKTLSHWTRTHPEQVERMRPLFKAMLSAYRKSAPRAYAKQRRECTLPFLGLPMTSAAMNCNFRTGLHKDRNDIEGTMGVMLVAGDDRVKGGELVMPEYGVGVDVRRGDLIVFNSHLWHANAAFKNKSFERLTLVIYAR